MFDVIKLNPGEKGEVVFAPSVPVPNPVMYTSLQGGASIVDEIVHGRASLKSGGISITSFTGSPLGVTVTKDEPLKVIVKNDSPLNSVVGVCLVASKCERE